MSHLLHQLLDRAATRRPDAPAVVLGEARVTYEALTVEAGRVAALLRAEGVRPGDRVALYLPKSLAGITALYGVLTAGAAYVPLDPFAPARRVALILRDCGVAHLVTTARLLRGLLSVPPDLLPPLVVLLADAADAWEEPLPPCLRLLPWRLVAGMPATPPPAARAVIEDDLAYVLYTSGSTGEPKGVAISHRGALAFVEWAIDTLGFREDDCFSNHAPLHFDLSVLDLFGAAGVAAPVVPVPEGVLPFPAKVAELIEAAAISIWYSVPSALIQLLTAGRLERFAFARLRQVLFAGEVFPVRQLRELMARLPHAVFYNLYGPTETNVCTYYRVPSLADDRVAPIPIGGPCENTEAFAVTEDGRRAAVGETGELLVRGPSLMKGYWGRPDKTAEVLVPHPFHADYPERVYRTGDLVVPQADGTYLFLGRRDQMVKIRGHRVELGEIEATLHGHPEIREAAAVAIPDQPTGSRLLAVVVPREEGGLSARQVRGYCAERLPRYMVPDQVEFRTALPRTSTGKVDRRRLTDELAEKGAPREYVDGRIENT